MKCAIIAVLALAAVCSAVPVEKMTFTDAVLAKEKVAPGTNWAVIVAGSNTWGNYRHQADVCHAYQVLHANGIADDHIIVMMYDDIAQNSQNPTPGIVINNPNGTDVYHGVPKDYTGQDVTPANFLKVLRGDKQGLQGVGSGRVLESGPNDNVFINFADHGGPGIIAFPTELLHSSDLIDALKHMHTSNMYHQLVFYMEACESGSMFSGILPADINIFATTAANPDQSSYACYFDSKLNTYLGDVYSVKWMEDSDRGMEASETLQQQYEKVKQETTTSEVMEYGDTSMSSETINHFQSGAGAKKQTKRVPAAPITDAVSQRDVPMAILTKKLANLAAKRDAINGNSEEALSQKTELTAQMDTVQYEISTLQMHMAQVRSTYSNIGTAVAGNALLFQGPRKELTVAIRPCVATSIQAFHDKCFNMGQHEEALRYAYMFTNLCSAGHSSDEIVKAINMICNN